MLGKIIKKCIDTKRKISFSRRIVKYQKSNQKWLLENKAYDDSANKEECFIIGNGPSIKDFDFSILEGKDIFTVNQIARNENFNKIHIKYHFWADPMFFYEDENHNKTISDDMYEQMLKVVNNNDSVVCFVYASLDNGVVRSLKNDGARIYRYPGFSSFCDYFYKQKPSLSKPSPFFYNVIQYAIYTAIAMGYKKIYLLGSEQTGLLNALNTKLNNSAEESYYGYHINQQEKERMVKHFSKFSVATYLQEHAIMFGDFEKLSLLAIRNSVNIFNCTPKSLIDSFEKIDITKVL